MIYFVTNRNLITTPNNYTTFGHEFSDKGDDEVRLGWIINEPKTDINDVNLVEDEDSDDYVDGRDFHLVKEPENTRSLENNPPSRRLFNLYRANRAQHGGKPRNVVFFVHGYNSNFQATVQAAFNLERQYNVDVLLFSWPSRGKGPTEEPYPLDHVYGPAGYKRDKRRAERSAKALKKVIARLASYFDEIRDERCDQKISLICFSMGTYVLKKMILPSNFDEETSMFDNVILTAPDVNQDKHGEWVSKLSQRGHVYVTINRNDFPLGWSQRKLGPKQRRRLGNNLPKPPVEGVTYLDFTHYPNIGKKHGHVTDLSWIVKDEKNVIVKPTPAQIIENSDAKKILHAIINGLSPNDVLREAAENPERQIFTIKPGSFL